ncbi:MAG: ABC transporter permease [Lachnospiraceae bacterium]|nr:ABC transporter permease [Lachnospiraceae bacterium]
MKSKLSATKFVANNKKQVWVMMLALSMTFMTMYLINFLFMTTQESYQVLCFEQPQKVAFVNLSLETMGLSYSDDLSDEDWNRRYNDRKNEIMEKLRLCDGVSDVFYTQTLNAQYRGLVGSIGYDFPLLEASQIQSYLDHMDAKLVSGRMPQNAGEILVDEIIYKNQHMKLDGYFMEDAFGKVFRVVGVVKSDYMICVGIPDGFTNTGWYMVVLCNEDTCNMKNLLNRIGIQPTEYDGICDVVHWKEDYNEWMSQLNASLLGILLVVMIILAISILVAYVSFMRSRVSEYCLYISIGYSRKDIYTMMMKEVGIIFGVSIVLGSVISLPVMFAFGHFVLDNIGLLYRYFYPEHLLRILAAYAAIIAFLQIPMILTINKIKTVDEVEE